MTDLDQFRAELRDAGAAPDAICEYIGIDETALQGVYRLAEAKLTALQDRTKPRR